MKLHFNQVTASIKGGLVHLDSTPEQPELPFASMLAENTIFSTANRDDPLFRLDGRDQLDDLGNKIQWEGRKVAYDRIKTYRRDEVVKTGGTPRIYNRADWTSAFLPKDDSPILGDVDFLREIDPARPPGNWIAMTFASPRKARWVTRARLEPDPSAPCRRQPLTFIARQPLARR